MNNILFEKLSKDGFCVVSLLSNYQVDKLLHFFEEVSVTAGVYKEFYTSIWSNNEKHRRIVDQAIKEVLFPSLGAYFTDIKPVFANFMVKYPGTNSSLLPHQDWSFVDEPQFESYTIWVPLVNVGRQNGNLQIIPGSHNRFKNFNRARFEDAPFDREMEAKEMVDIPMNAGEALILNSRIIHASPPNITNSKRIAVSIVVAPQEAPLKHWIIAENRKLELQIDDSFFWKFSCFDNLNELLNLNGKEKTFL